MTVGGGNEHEEDLSLSYDFVLHEQPFSESDSLLRRGEIKESLRGC
jgi:hypothetical protein